MITRLLLMLTFSTSLNSLVCHGSEGTILYQSEAKNMYKQAKVYAPYPDFHPEFEEVSLSDFETESNYSDSTIPSDFAECPIRGEIFMYITAAARTTCCHWYDLKSLKTWLKRSKTCPVCRSEIKSKKPKDLLIVKRSKSCETWDEHAKRLEKKKYGPLLDSSFFKNEKTCCGCWSS